MYNIITQSENLSWSSMLNAANSNPEVKACVRKVTGNQCQFSPCMERDGVLEDTPYPDATTFGYAGHFVHRHGNIAKPLPASEYFTINFGGTCKTSTL